MGGEKARLVLEGKTLLERCAERLLDPFRDILVVADTEARCHGLPYRCVADRRPRLGPIGGLETALCTIETDAAFVAACDMPFLNPDVIRSMIDAFGESDLLIPVIAGRLHPLHAIYAKRCLPAIQAQIREGDLALHHLADAVKSAVYPETAFRRHDPLLRSVTNINTPEALEDARRRMVGE